VSVVALCGRLAGDALHDRFPMEICGQSAACRSHAAPSRSHDAFSL